MTRLTEDVAKKYQDVLDSICQAQQILKRLDEIASIRYHQIEKICPFLWVVYEALFTCMYIRVYRHVVWILYGLYLVLSLKALPSSCKSSAGSVVYVCLRGLYVFVCWLIHFNCLSYVLVAGNT